MIDAFGWFVAVLGCSISLPQLLRLVRARTVAGVALTTWQVTLGANLAWTSHGWVIGQVTLWGPNLILAICTLFILQMFHRHTATPWVRLLLPGVTLAAITTVIDLAAGPIAFAVAAVVPSVVSMTAQLITLARSVELSGVSFTFLVINVVNQALWLVWGFLVGEQAMLLACSLIGVLWLVNLVWFSLRRIGLVGPIRPLDAAIAGGVTGGIGEVIPGMVPGLPNVVDEVPSVFDAIPEVIDALPDVITDALPDVIDALPDVISDAIPDVVTDALPEPVHSGTGVTGFPDGPAATDLA